MHLRVAAVQLNSTADRPANLAVADRLTRAAAADGATLIVLPEKWTAMGSDEDQSAAAEPLDGPAVEWARALARELGVELVAGSFLERVPGRRSSPTPRCTSTAAARSRAVYRKIHMFDVRGRRAALPRVRHRGGRARRSSSPATAGGVELGLSICYDLRFPELYRILAVRGARVIAIPAAFTLATTRDHWETLVRARAIENQAFVIAANQVGPHPAGQHSGGRSMIVDPWGVVLAQAPDSECHIVAELDLERQREIRERLPSLANRRPAAYRWPGGARGRMSRSTRRRPRRTSAG